MDIDPISLITSGGIVIALTQQAKRWVPTDFLTLVAILFGGVIQLVNDWALATEPISKGDWWMTIVTGIGVGLLAAGVYDVAGRAGPVIPPAQINVEDSWLPVETGPILGADSDIFVDATTTSPIEPEDELGPDSRLT